MGNSGLQRLAAALLETSFPDTLSSGSKLPHSRLLLLFATLLALATLARAQAPPNYPAKPIRIIVGAVPGGGADIMARAAAQRLSERWGKSVVVDNRAGASGMIGIEMLVQSPPDGYTLFGGASLIDRKSTRLNSSHVSESRMPSSA